MIRPMRIVIASSLLLNILLIGIILGGAGHFAIRPPFGQHPGGPPPLSADKQRLIDEAMQRNQPDITALREQFRAARQDMVRLLKAEPFNRDAYLEQSKKTAELHNQLIDKINLTIADTAPQFAPDEREALLGLLRKPKGPPGDPTPRP